MFRTLLFISTLFLVLGSSAQELGTIDQTFKPTFKFDKKNYQFHWLKVDRQDRIYVVETDYGDEFKVTRLSKEGEGGEELTKLNKDLRSFPTLDEDGLIYALKQEGDGKFVWRRFNEDGQEDPLFGIEASERSNIHCSKLTSRKIYILDEIDEEVEVLTRYTRAGAVDKSFLPIYSERMTSVCEDPAGNLFLLDQIGWLSRGCGGQRQYTARKFDDHGKVEASFTLGTIYSPQWIQFQSDGKIFAKTVDTETWDQHLERFYPDGRIDDSFERLSSSDWFGLKIMKDNSLLFLSDYEISKLDQNGLPDRNFAGYKYIDEKYASIATQSNGDILFLSDQENGKVNFSRLSNALDQSKIYTELETKPALIAYPNPVSGQLTIKKEDVLSTDVLLTITDIAGNPVATETSKMDNGQVQLNMALYPPGMYSIKIRGGSLNEEVKVLKR